MIDDRSQKTVLDSIALKRLKVWVNSPGEPILTQADALAFELGQIGYRLTNLAEFTRTTQAEFQQRVRVLLELRGDVPYVVLNSLGHLKTYNTASPSNKPRDRL